MALSAQAQPTSFTYQGILSEASGPANGRYDFEFRLFNAPTNGTQFGGARALPSVAVNQGQFTVALDFGCDTFAGSSVWLEIKVRPQGSPAPFVTLAPRQAVNPAPQSLYSIRAGTAATVENITVNPLTTNSPSAITNIFRSFTSLLGITPFEFGAAGDGKTDDTVALQKWLNTACAENRTAILPPAPGGFYKITDELLVTNSMSIIGQGGGKHMTSWPVSKSHIRQFGLGKNGIRITHPNDSVRLESFVVTSANPYNWKSSSVGVWFNGGNSDTDCAVVNQILVTNFGIGMLVGDLADSTISQCSVGYNGIGLLCSNLANNITVQGCQIHGNYYYGISLQPTVNMQIIGSDLVARYTTNTYIADITNNGQHLFLMNCIFEHTAGKTRIEQRHGYLTSINCFYPDWTAQPSGYAMRLDNPSSVLLAENIFNTLGPEGLPIVETNAISVVFGWGRPVSYLYAPLPTLTFTNQTGPFLHDITTSGRTEARQFPGTIDWVHGSTLAQSDTRNDTWLYAKAFLGKYGYGEGGNTNLSARIDLLQYAKEKASIAMLSGVQAAWLQTTGAPPVIEEIGRAAGPTSGATASIMGTDTDGLLTINTGSSVIGDTNICTVLFSHDWGISPTVALTANNSKAAVAHAFVTTTPRRFSIAVAGTLSPNSSYRWFYHVLR